MSFLLLLLLLFFFIKKQFKYDEVKRIYILIIPVFSIIMFISRFTPSKSNLIYLSVIAIIAALISWYQARYTQVKIESDLDKYGRKQALIKGGYPYLIGWILVFIVELGLIWSKTGKINLLKTLTSDLRLELFEFSRFSSNESEWFIWALSGFTAYFYSLWLRLYNSDVKNALRNRHSR